MGFGGWAEKGSSDLCKIQVVKDESHLENHSFFRSKIGAGLYKALGAEECSSVVGCLPSMY